ncbi:hypothetical protein KEM48_002843 [Puccinia striiformis f. sp. tritici PST-130]|nr:hypothetical protein H4Q26_002750 [Puccinia striiformis f. sp. tritici PST-130]KAI9609667.1 hypothetical protein KEM48_002837 [Puccinia striiformis f. sp. tritici PST-130]KAI9609672.1 hypothetical protein KEM48_002843 [Puccinia striiformis f. sp. tritici PST-130]
MTGTNRSSIVINRANDDRATWKQHESVVVKNLSSADINNQQPSNPDLSAQLEQDKSNKDQATTNDAKNSSKPGTENQENKNTSKNPEDELKSQSTVQAKEPSSSDPTKPVGRPEANQPSQTKDDSKNSPLANKSEPTQSDRKDPVTILTELSKLTPSESNKNPRLAGPGLV